MNMKKVYLAAAALLSGIVSSGQNLNPTVEVTNVYNGNPSEVNKPLLEMAVPDTLLRFNMDFDYEVFEKQYQGAYSFKPYMLNMKPDKDAYRGRSFFLKAGAGYSLHPQFQMVFSPEQKGRFQMSVFAGHKSYFGDYLRLQETLDNDVFIVDRVKDSYYSGYDAVSDAGFEGRYNFNRAIAVFDMGYHGILNKGPQEWKRSFNAADFHACIRSNRVDQSYLFYGLDFSGRFGNDRIYDASLRSGEFSLNGEIGPQLNYFNKLLVGFEAESGNYTSSYLNSNIGRLAVIPKYVLETGRWKLSLGLRIDKLIFDEGEKFEGLAPKGLYDASHFHPDIHASFSLWDNLQLYSDLTGGARLNTYSSLLERNHHFNPFVLSGFVLMDNSEEEMNLKLGLRGNLGSRLQFDISGGGAKIANGILDRPTDILMCQGFFYADYSLLYADALLGLNAGGFRFDAGLHFRSMEFDEEDSYVEGFKLPKFSGTMRAVYNFNQRVYAGLTAEAATSREGYVKTSTGSSFLLKNQRIPGYLDLGLVAGYQVSRKFGLWMESGNLLCETVQRNPYYAEKDLWVTAGITLNF